MRTQPEGLPLKYRAVVGATRLVLGFLSGYVLVCVYGGIPAAVVSSSRNPNPFIHEETRRRAFVVKV